MKYEEIPQIVEAFQVPFGVNIRVPHRMPLSKSDSVVVNAPAGYWIVKDASGQIRVLTNAEFESKYHLVRPPNPFSPPKTSPWYPGRLDEIAPYRSPSPWGQRPTIIWYTDRTSDNTRT